MSKLFLPLIVIFLSISLLLIPVYQAGSKSIITGKSKKISKSSHLLFSDSLAEAESSALYDSMELNDIGLSKKALLYAFKGLQHLVEKGMLSNKNILTVCDFSQPSQNKRMYIIDLKNRKVLLNTYVAHGRNSGIDYAEHFSNNPESLESSLGFYVTKNTYIGKHGLSLKLSGLEEGFNDNAEARAVVVHGAPYIGMARSGNANMGRSWGCPAVPQKLAPKVIQMIKNGTCLFIYHPDQGYLNGSTIING